MCLILMAYERHPEYRIILAANRDEFYERPTSPLDHWFDHSFILGGRDLKEHGTWLGITRTGRLAAITNYRDPASNRTDLPSRGLLVSRFLMAQASPQMHMALLEQTDGLYNGFNLLLGDRSGLFYFSNRGDGVRRIDPGLYGISNHLIDTPWPKVERGKAKLEKLLATAGPVEVEAIFDLLGDRTPFPGDTLPDTGIGMEWERILSPLFITSPTYGTRSSSIILERYDGSVTFLERTFNGGTAADTPQTRKFEFQIQPISKI